MSATGNGRDAGFTLIEALAVVAIAALVSGLAYPRMQSLIGGQEFRMASSAVTLGVRETRAAAIRSGEPARFRIAQDAAAFSVNGRAAQALPSAVALKSSGGALVFYPDGTSNGGALTLTAQGREQRFVIFPTTGLIALAAR